MKIFILILLLVNSSVYAQSTVLDALRSLKSLDAQVIKDSESFNFTCATATPTTSVDVITVDNDVNLRVFHHNGIRYIPIHAGVITYSDLPYLKDKGELVMDLGEAFELRFDRASCRKQDSFTYECFSNTETQLGLQTLKSYSFQTYKSTVKLYGNTYETLHFFFSFNINNFVKEVRYDYQLKTDCTFL